MRPLPGLEQPGQHDLLHYSAAGRCSTITVRVAPRPPPRPAVWSRLLTAWFYLVPRCRDTVAKYQKEKLARAAKAQESESKE